MISDYEYDRRQREFDDYVYKQEKKMAPGMRCVYFPGDELFSVWLNDRQITGDHKTRLGAIKEALDEI